MDIKDNNKDAIYLEPEMQELPDIDNSGTYWIVKAPEHGFRQANVIGFDDDFNYQYSDNGNIYCGNCQQYAFYKNIDNVSNCKTCDASFKAGAWFNTHTYQVEINGRTVGSGLSYNSAVEMATKKRSPKNSIYISFEMKD